MGSRSDALARQLEEAVDEFARAIESCSSADWGVACEPEGWSVAVTAQHVAGQFPLEREIIEAMVRGGKALSYDWDYVNGKNDARAAASANCTKAEVVALLRKDAATMAGYVRSLSDEDLDRSAPFTLAGGASPTAQQLIEGGVLIEHVTGHLASIRSATAERIAR